jgi:hypothetical protein
MGRLLITSYHTPGCVVHSYNDCVSTKVARGLGVRRHSVKEEVALQTNVDLWARQCGNDEVWGSNEEVWPA